MSPSTWTLPVSVLCITIGATVACRGAAPPGDGDHARPAPAVAAPASASPGFVRVPGGGLEVSAEQVAKLRGSAERVRIVDVREPAELGDELGHIPDVESVPLAGLVAASEGWDRTAPLVLVCRSGRRSARAAETLEARGFTNVASMTGGMARWNELGLPTAR